MNIIKHLQWRYAVKKFNSTKKLSNQQLIIIKEAFNLTASSYGLQPVKLLIIKNKDIQNQLVKHSWNQQQVAQAAAVLVFCIPKKYTIEEVENYFKLVKEIRNTPDTILAPFKEMLQNTINNKTQEELFEWNKNQAYLAMGNLLTVCASEKIDACPMEGFIAQQYNTILNLEKENLSAVLTMPIGFRAEDDYMKDLKKVRKKTDDVVIEIN